MTPAQEEQFLALVAEGNTLAAAAKVVGFSRSTISNKRERNPAFAERLNDAEEQLESAITGQILKAAKKDWRAGAWYAERKWPQRWARPEIRNEVTNVNVSAADVANAIHLGLAKLAERHAPPGQIDVEDLEAKPVAT